MGNQTKVTHAAIAGSIATILILVLSLFKVDLPAGFEGAITTILITVLTLVVPAGVFAKEE